MSRNTIGPITAEHWRYAFRDLEPLLTIDENSPLMVLLRTPSERACSRPALGVETCVDWWPAHRNGSLR